MPKLPPELPFFSVAGVVAVVAAGVVVAASTFFTVIVTVSVSVSRPSLADNSKTNVVVSLTSGATNTPFVNVTAKPDICDQVNVSSSLSSSVAVPANVTVSPSLTLCSSPALALGAWFFYLLYTRRTKPTSTSIWR